MVCSYLMASSRGQQNKMYSQVQLGTSIKLRQKLLISLCINDLQKGGGTEALLWVLEVFVLPVTNSGSLENVVPQGFDTSCTSWPAMLFNPVLLTILKHVFINAQVCKGLQLACMPMCIPVTFPIAVLMYPSSGLGAFI